MTWKIEAASSSPFFGCLVLALALFCHAEAASVRTLNLVEMEKYADRIFWGRCISVSEAGQAIPGVPIQEVTFLVNEAIRGVRKGQEVTFRQLQGVKPGGLGIAGLPSYRKGQEALLFLYADSSRGLTSPVGLQQGVFQVRRGGEGGATVINPMRNRNLAFGLGADKAAAMGLDRSDLDRLRKNQPLSMTNLIRMVEQIRSHRLSADTTVK